MVHRVAEGIGTVLRKVMIPILMALLSLLVFFQVLNRFVLHIPASWTEEFSRYAFVWGALFGAAEAARSGADLNVEFFQDLFGGALKRSMRVIADLLSIVFFGFLAYQGCSWTFRNGFKVMADTVPIPMFYIQVVIPVAAAIIVLFLVDRLSVSMRRREGGKEA